MSRVRAIVALLALLATAGPACVPPCWAGGGPDRRHQTAQAGVGVSWQQTGASPAHGEVRVRGLPISALAQMAAIDLAADAGERLLRVVVEPAGTAESGEALPSLWGTWGVNGDALVFRPRHVPAPGTRLRARFDGRAFDALTGTRGTADATLRIEIPASESVARVLVAHPGGETVPANLLRFYVEFSKPMSLRDVERHVRLLRADGTPIDSAFASPADGLWDPARRRLTLIVHPGRVKQGLVLGDTLGPVLLEGETVTLAIDAELRDADGATLQNGFRRSWRVTAPVSGAIDLDDWELKSPDGPRGTLVARVPVGLDRAVALRALSVLDPEGSEVRGDLELVSGEREVRFTPTDAWRPGGRYRLVAAPFLEDVSGNRLGRAFERAGMETHDGSGSAESIGFLGAIDPVSKDAAGSGR